LYSELVLMAVLSPENRAKMTVNRAEIERLLRQKRGLNSGG